MKKLFISQPMKDRPDSQIKEDRLMAIKEVERQLEEEVEVINSFIENAPSDATPLWFLGKSLELLSMADIAYFAKDWYKYRGCRIEHVAALSYGIKVIEYVKNKED